MGERQGQWTDERFLDLRYGMNKGRPTTVIPKTARPSNKKGVKTYVHPIDGFRFFFMLIKLLVRRRPLSSLSSERLPGSLLTRSESWSC